MALLLISAVAEDLAAAPGNTSDLAIAVSVTSAAGVPITGLTASNFSIGSHFVPAGGATSIVNSVSSSGTVLSGCYTMRLNPSSGNWLAGVYIYDLRVVNGADQGTIVISVLMD